MKKIIKTLSLTLILSAGFVGTIFGIGAGILPYIIEKDEKGNNEVYFLLRMNTGKKSEKDWRKKNQLSTFGGESKDETTKTFKTFREVAAKSASKISKEVFPEQYLLDQINENTPMVGNTFLVSIQDLTFQYKGKTYRYFANKENNDKRGREKLDKGLDKSGFKPYSEWVSRTFLIDRLNSYEYLHQCLIDILNDEENMQKIKNIK